MNTFWRDCDAVLRGNPDTPLPRLLRVILLGGILYGFAMGTYALRAGPERWAQVLVSGAKVPLLLGVTALLGMPSFRVFHLMLGLGDDWPRVVRGLCASQAAFAVLLAALCPFTLLCYASTSRYPVAVACNAVVWAFAAWQATRVLRRHYQTLLQRDIRHRSMLRAWTLLYAFVGVQMGWVLRPFVGDPESPLALWRSDAWSNAYLEVGRIFLRALGS